MTSDFPQDFELSNLLDIPFGRIINSRFLSKTEMSVLFMLITNRRSLPVYHGNYWACYECTFKSRSIETMAIHIMRSHESAPFTDEEILETEELVV